MKAVLIQAQIQEVVADGVIGERVKRTVERLRTISQTDLPTAVREHEEVRKDILNGGYDDIYDAYRKLDQETSRLVEIAHKLLDIRHFIGEMG